MSESTDEDHTEMAKLLACGSQSLIMICCCDDHTLVGVAVDEKEVGHGLKGE